MPAKSENYKISSTKPSKNNYSYQKAKSGSFALRPADKTASSGAKLEKIAWPKNFTL